MTPTEYQRQSRARIDSQQRRFNAELTRVYRQARDTIQTEIDKLYRRALAGADPADYWGLTVRLNRWNRLQGQIREAMNQAAERAGVIVEQASRLSFSNTYYQNQYLMQVGGAAQGVNLSFTWLPQELIELAVFNLPDRLAELNQEAIKRFRANELVPEHARTLQDLFRQHNASGVRRVRDTITQALVQGQPLDKMARRLDGAVSIPRNNMERILRTETHRLREMAKLASISNARADGVRGRRRIEAVLDDRTRAQSAQVDGEVENDDGLFQYPDMLVASPGNSGVAAWDINDREIVVMDIPGLEPNARRVRMPGDRPPPEVRRRLQAEGRPVPGENYVISWQKFGDWAESVGLSTNRYGELVV